MALRIRQPALVLPTSTTTVTPVVSRRVWTQQPQGSVRLDPKYGAVAGVYGSMVWDAASGQSTIIDTNGVSTAVYAGSLGKKFTGSGTGSVKTVILQDTAAYTYVFNAILAGAGSSGLGRPLSTFNGTGGHDLFFSSSSLRIQEWFSTLRGEWYINQNTFFYTPKTFVVSYDASSASNIPRVWVDGRQSTVFVNTTPSGSRISGGLTLGIGNRPDTTARQLDGVMFMAAMLPYAANDGLAQSLSLNPWQLFAPQRQVSYFLPSTGITPVVSRRVWTRQPPFWAQANRAFTLDHLWWANGARVQAPIGGALSLIDAAGNADGVFGTGTGIVTSGNSIRIDDAGPYISIDDTGTGTIDSKKLAVGNSNGSGAPNSTRWSVFILARLASTSGFSPLYMGPIPGGIEIRTAGASVELLKCSIVSIATSSANLVANRWVSIGVTYDGTTANFYINGQSAGSGASAQTFTSGQYYISDRYTRSGDRVRLFAVFSGVLGASTFNSLHANPWQLFAPQRQVTYFGTSGGGTVYNLSISETSLTSDSISSIVTWFASLSETATVSDSPSTTVIFPTAISETATVSDSPSTTVIFPTAISETATVSDSPTTTVIFPTAISETATVSDSPTTTVIFPTAISETATGSDATASSFALSSAVSETATGLDTTDSAFALASAVSETATASETNTSSLIVYPSVSETATASESITTVLIIYPSISETATAADTITTIATLNVGVTETVTATDIVTGATTMTVTLSETATASDSVVVAVPVTAAIAETATASESVDSSLVYLGNIDETVTASESISTIATQNVEVLETTSAADSVTIGGSYQVSLSETVVAADAATSRFLWEPIDTSQTPGWSNISTTQNANWSSITTTQTANWQPVNTGS